MRSLRPTRQESEEGSIALFITLVAVSLLAVTGLVSDGGIALEARAKASDLAQACARAGTRGLNVTTLRNSGVLSVSTPEAQAAVKDYETNAGIPAAEQCDMVYADRTGGQVTVHARVTIKTDTNLLRLIGIPSFTEQETAVATVTQALPR